jgi:hypothetical protein
MVGGSRVCGGMFSGGPLRYALKIGWVDSEGSHETHKDSGTGGEGREKEKARA